MRDGCGAAMRAACAVVARDAEGAGFRSLEGGEAAPLASVLARLDADWMLWVTSRSTLDPLAWAAFAEGCERRGARIVYADHDAADGAGRPARPSFKPAWDRWQILERDYAGPLLAVHRDLVASIDAPRLPGNAGPWRTLIEASATLPDEAVVHAPRVVVHAPPARNTVQEERAAVLPALRDAARARGLALEVVGGVAPWLRYAGSPSVSIVVPTRDRARLLRRCLEAVAQTREGREVEVVVVDNGSSDRGVHEAIERARRTMPVEVVGCAEAFNFPRLCNVGVAAARGDVVVLLNNDTVVQPGWLRELAALAVQPGVGAVGPLLAYPGGDLQSAGVLLGVNRTATSALAGFSPDDPAARAWCGARRRVSVVLGACLAIRRTTYGAVGGLDERFAVSHNEVDFCLRLEAAGYANLFTPYARVLHDEGATRGFEVTPAERARLAAEERAFRERWGALLQPCDPAYHPALARAGVPFALGAPGEPVAPRAGWRCAHGDA